MPSYVYKFLPNGWLKMIDPNPQNTNSTEQNLFSEANNVAAQNNPWDTEENQ